VKNLVFMIFIVFLPMLQLRGFWQDGRVRTIDAQLYGSMVSNFLSHRIVKSLSCRVFGILEFQCIRNGSQNLPVCPGSPQNAFIMFSHIFQNHLFFKLMFMESKSDNLKS
jgi:hypothetical protein